MVDYRCRFCSNTEISYRFLKMQNFIIFFCSDFCEFFIIFGHFLHFLSFFIMEVDDPVTHDALNETQDEEIREENKPHFVLVEFSQLEKLLQHCPECGRAPGGRSTGKPRNIQWTKRGRM